MGTPPRLKPGTPHALWLFRHEPADGRRGGRRSLLYVATVDAGLEAHVARLWGAGRYRIEVKDKRGQIVTVRMLLVAVDGSVARVGRRVRKRRVPPPRGLPQRRPMPITDRSGRAADGRHATAPTAPEHNERSEVS